MTGQPQAEIQKRDRTCVEGEGKPSPQHPVLSMALNYLDNVVKVYLIVLGIQ